MYKTASPTAAIRVGQPVPRAARAEVLAIGTAAVMLAALNAAAFQWGLDHGLQTDLLQHARNAAFSNALGIPWPHFLSYWMISAPCGFCADSDKILGSLPTVIGVLIAAKFLVSYAMLRTGIGFLPRTGRGSTRPIAGLAAVALLLSLAFSLPLPNPYRGQLPANQWHNTTTIALMPLALLAFWAACRFMRQPSPQRAAWVAAAGLLSIAAKPNFAMAFIPAFPVQLHLSGLPRRWKLVGLAATGIIALGLAIQYGWMYHSDSFAELRTAVLRGRGQDPDTAWGLAVAPFATWSEVSSAIPISIVSMLLFPLLAAAARPAAARKSSELRFAWLLFGFALTAFIVFDETGRNTGAANFRWGGIATMYILFLVSTALLLEPRRAGVSRRQDVLAWSAFAAHVVAGVFVLAVFAQRGTYLQLNWKGLEF